MYLQTRYYPGVQGLYGGPEPTRRAAANNTAGRLDVAADGTYHRRAGKAGRRLRVTIGPTCLREPAWSVPQDLGGICGRQRDAAEPLRRLRTPSFMAIGHGLQGQLARVSAHGELAGQRLRQRSLYWHDMATVDEPFARGRAHPRGVHRWCMTCLQKGVLGADPLGLGYDRRR